MHITYFDDARNLKPNGFVFKVLELYKHSSGVLKTKLPYFFYPYILIQFRS